MAYQVELWTTVDEVPTSAWREVCPADDLFMDPRLLRTIERTRPPSVKIWYVLVRTSGGAVAAAACLSLLPLDLAMLAGGFVRGLAGLLRPVFPGALSYTTVCCGLPISAGQSHFRVHATADVAEVLTALNQTMADIAHTEGARFLIFKEFNETEVTRFAGLTNLDYYRGESPAMNYLPGEFRSFDEYLATLKAPYRSKIKRSQRKAESHHLRMESLTDGEAIAARFSEAAYQQYLAVVGKTEVRLETLTAEWFREMARQFPEECVWLTVWEADHLAAWAFGLVWHDAYYSLYGGVDYTRNAETDAYFNLMYHELGFAFERGVRQIILGQTADDFKSRLGALQDPRWIFIRPLRWKASLALRLGAERLLPHYPAPEARHVFHAGAGE